MKNEKIKAIPIGAKIKLFAFNEKKVIAKMEKIRMKTETTETKDKEMYSSFSIFKLACFRFKSRKDNTLPKGSAIHLKPNENCFNNGSGKKAKGIFFILKHLFF
ncbi:MAG: hypothetical protein ABH824_02630 [Nanoarchaeota archaeon]|nr:hypothetical protein [Nanoarchaeota archaeon]MBU1876187.1 hypothetical protein [Nanoarchaeota archaeon]